MFAGLILCRRLDDENLRRRGVPGVLGGVSGGLRGVWGDGGAMAIGLG